jgi:hypothetical protein
MRPPRLSRPPRSEVPESYEEYFACLPGDDAWPELVSQTADVERLLGGLSEDRALFRYAPGKWSVKEVLGHLNDCERVFGYRALRFARGDPTPLADFDENTYARAGGFDARHLTDLVDEFRACRTATVSLFRSFDEAALLRSGVARGLRFSVRSLAWVTASHLRHHLDVLGARYGLA